MLHYVTGDLLDPKFTIFCHQVNCQGVMGGGVAKQIKNKYPNVFAAYQTRCRIQKENNKPLLGKVQWVKTPDGRLCANMFAQDRYGHDKCYTDYFAFRDCLINIIHTIEEYDMPAGVIAFPYKIGCGLAGGNWNVILPMIEEFAKRIPIDVYIVEKE